MLMGEKMGRKRIDREKLAKLVKEGKSDKEIARILGCSIQAVQKIRIEELGIKRRRGRKRNFEWKLVKADLSEIGKVKKERKSKYSEILKEFLRRRMRCARVIMKGKRAKSIQVGLYTQAKRLGILKKVRIVIRKGKVYLVRR